MNRLFGAFAVLAGVIIIILSGFFINTHTAGTVEKFLSLSMKYTPYNPIYLFLLIHSLPRNKYYSYPLLFL